MNEAKKLAIITGLMIAIATYGGSLMVKYREGQQLTKIRAQWAQTCIKDVMAEEFRLRPKDNPERLSIVEGCTGSGFLLYPAE
jgi:hypothetical protein